MERRRTRPRAADGRSLEPLGRTCVACESELFAKRCGRCGVSAKAGDYLVQRVLHESERGRVYLARGSDGRRVALKELVFATVPDATTVDAFLREGRVLQELSQPGIPRFVDAFQEGEGAQMRLYLAQEYVDGTTLEKAITAGPMTEVDAYAVARAVLPILSYLHGRTPMLVHRDVKPANLVRRRDGTIALVDFDAACDVRREGTHRATLVGTFGYMPLEQMGGSVDATADLYALGATLVHLVTGRPPHELLTKEFELDLSSLKARSQWAGTYDTLFTRWLRRMVARHPADRFQSADEALAALNGRAAIVAPEAKAKPTGAGFRSLWRLAAAPAAFGAGALFGSGAGEWLGFTVFVILLSIAVGWMMSGARD